LPAVRERLLEVLADPITGTPLRLEKAKRRDGQIHEGTLVSDVTGASYPIVRGIPRFVGANNYTSSFGLQWNLFRDSQLDSVTGATRSQNRFDAELGWTRHEMAGRWVLDAGCGAGRFAEIAAARGANLVALDSSLAVEAAAETLRPFPEVDVVQGNILEPPFREGAFAFAYSIGVIQHTSDRMRAIAAVIRSVARGGQFGFSIYARRPWTKLNSKYLLRPLTTRVAAQKLLSAIETSMPVLFPLTEKLFRVPVLGKVARFGIPVANYVENGEFTKEQRYREAVLDTFDMLSPQYDMPMIWQEVDDALRIAGASRWQFRTRVPINVVGEC
jgi:SAM-dependent methyltransferase